MKSPHKLTAREGAIGLCVGGAMSGRWASPIWWVRVGRAGEGQVSNGTSHQELWRNQDGIRMDHRRKVREGCVTAWNRARVSPAPTACAHRSTHTSSSHWLSFLWCVCRTRLKIQDKNNTKPPSPVIPSGLFHQKTLGFAVTTKMPSYTITKNHVPCILCRYLC